MKAVVIYEAGDSSKLIYQDIPKPMLKEGWSLVRIRGFGLNHSEIFTRKGLSPTVQFPRVLGIECVGEIAESTDLQRLPVGQKVISLMGELGRAFNGSYAEYALIPNQSIYPITTDLSWTTLATIPETYYTAFGSLKKLRIDSNDQVLVRGAASGVGLAFLTLLKSRYPQLSIEGSTRTLAKKEQLEKKGFTHLVLDQEGELQTTKKYNKILELVGPRTIKNSFQHLHQQGIICSTGQLGGQWFLDTFDPILDTNNGYLTGFYSGNVNEQELADLFEYLARYQVTIKPEKIYRLNDVSRAHRYLETTLALGKVIVLNDVEPSET